MAAQKSGDDISQAFFRAKREWGGMMTS